MCSVDNKKGTHWHSSFPFEKEEDDEKERALSGAEITNLRQ